MTRSRTDAGRLPRAALWLSRWRGTAVAVWGIAWIALSLLPTVGCGTTVPQEAGQIREYSQATDDEAPSTGMVDADPDTEADPDDSVDGDDTEPDDATASEPVDGTDDEADDEADDNR